MKAFEIAGKSRKGADTRQNTAAKRIGRTVLAAACVLSLLLLTACGSAAAPAPAQAEASAAPSGRVVIYTPTEDYLIEYMQQRLDEAFPDCEISIEYYHTGDLAAKVKAEGVDTECDIIFDCEYGYLQSLADILAPIDFVDETLFVEDMRSPDKTYMPVDRYSGSVIIREDMLKEKDLPIPESYEELLDPMYKGLIEMPNPAASSTGYLFLKSLANAWGDQAAVDYFHALDENILQYPGGGSGPVKDAAAGECAIALSLTFKAAELISDGYPLQIHFYKEGAPYTPAGLAIVKGHETDPNVEAVVRYYYSDIIDDYLNTYLPELVKVGQVNDIPNYPKDIPYSDMSNNTPDVKEALIALYED